MWQKNAPPELPEDDAARERMASRAHERALILLTYREHSCQQLYEKLCRSFPAEIAAEVVARLRESGLLSDARFAAQYAREAAARKFYAPARIVMELKTRGVDREQAQEAIDEVFCELEPETLMAQLLEKRFGGIPEDEQERRRAYAALLRLGWSPSDAKTALRAED